MQPAANNRKGRPSGRPFSCAWQFESHSSDHNVMKAGANTGTEKPGQEKPGQASFRKTGTGAKNRDRHLSAKNRDRHLSEISYHLPGLPLIVR